MQREGAAGKGSGVHVLWKEYWVDGHKGRTGDGERQDGRGRLTKTNSFENSIMKPDAFTLI